MSVTFHKRARVETCDFYRRRVWKSTCGGFRVSEFVSRLERRKAYYAERRSRGTWGGEHWAVISRHRSRTAAEVAVRKYKLLSEF